MKTILLVAACMISMSASASCIGLSDTQVVCDDGTTYTEVGTMVIGSDGSVFHWINGVLIPWRSSVEEMPSFVYDNKGRTWQKIGPMYIGSDGSTCNVIGGQIDCD